LFQLRIPILIGIDAVVAGENNDPGNPFFNSKVSKSRGAVGDNIGNSPARHGVHVS